MSDNIQVMKIKEQVDNQLKFTKDGKEYYGKYVFVMENGKFSKMTEYDPASGKYVPHPIRSSYETEDLITDITKSNDTKYVIPIKNGGFVFHDKNNEDEFISVMAGDSIGKQNNGHLTEDAAELRTMYENISRARTWSNIFNKVGKGIALTSVSAMALGLVGGVGPWLDELSETVNYALSNQGFLLAGQSIIPLFVGSAITFSTKEDVSEKLTLLKEQGFVNKMNEPTSFTSITVDSPKGRSR